MIGRTDSWGLDKEVNVQGTAPTQFSIATPGTDGSSVSLANGSASPLVGVFQFGWTPQQPQIRLRLAGLSMIIASAPINFGDFVTSDGNGNAVAAAPAYGASEYVIGMAMASVAAGQAVPVLVCPQRIQG